MGHTDFGKKVFEGLRRLYGAAASLMLKRALLRLLESVNGSAAGIKSGMSRLAGSHPMVSSRGRDDLKHDTRNEGDHFAAGAIGIWPHR